MDIANLASFSGAFSWIMGHGYALMFIVMLIEGPVITSAAAFGVALGFFDGWAVFLLSILGNLLPDAIYYAIGYWGRKKLVNRYAHYFGSSHGRITHLESLSERHAGKAMMLIKMIPFLATPGLIIVGAVRMPLKKYAWWSVILTVPSSLFFYIVGYYFGTAYNIVSYYLDVGGIFIIVALIIYALILYGYRILSERFAKKIDKD